MIMLKIICYAHGSIKNDNGIKMELNHILNPNFEHIINWKREIIAINQLRPNLIKS